MAKTPTMAPEATPEEIRTALLEDALEANPLAASITVDDVGGVTFVVVNA